MFEPSCPTCKQAITENHKQDLEEIQKKEKMNYGVVVMLDALGTKGIWRDHNLAEVTTTWEVFLKMLKTVEKESADEEKYEWKINAFSDTIIITFTGKPIEKLLDIASDSTRTAIGYGMQMGIYLRGAISVGSFIHTENLILGPAIDEAAEFYEQDNWIGASATPSTYSILRKLSENKTSNTVFSFIKYPIPRKQGMEKNGFAIIHNYWWKIKICHIPEMQGKTLIDLVHYYLEHGSDPTGNEKWKNLLDYIYYLKTKIKSSEESSS